MCPFDQVDLVPLIVSLLHNNAGLKWQIKAFKNCTTMNIFSEPLDTSFVGLSEDAYLEAICTRYRLQICSVPSNGGCFFDSIYALLPTVGKAVKSARELRLSCVEFFKECYQGQHGLVGERVQEDIRGSLEHKIVSSCLTRFTNSVRRQNTLAGHSRCGIWGVRNDLSLSGILQHLGNSNEWVVVSAVSPGQQLFLVPGLPIPVTKSCMR